MVVRINYQTINNMETRLIKKIELEGEIELLSGLHIGGTNSGMQIGGIDKGVIRNPINNRPYIPGSSLKGKMRAMLEISAGNIGSDNGVATRGPSAELFGNATGNKDQRASRLIVRDGHLVNHEELLKRTEMPYTEGKTEVALNRITSQANPRQLERVPAGAIFSMNMVLNIWEGEKEDELIRNLFKCLELLKDDYLGGHGSRGYGRIRIVIKRMTSKSTSKYYGVNDVEPDDLISLYQGPILKLK